MSVVTHSYMCRLPRDVLRIGGRDRAAFLQGLVSNDVTRCHPGSAVYAALLTPQGKFLHDMLIVAGGGLGDLTHGNDVFLLDCEAGRGADLLERLKMHKLRSKVEFENVTDDYDVMAFWGAQTDVFGSFLDPRLSALGHRMLLPKNITSAQHDQGLADIRRLGIVEAHLEDYDRYRLSLGVPDGSRDMDIEKSTLVESNLDRLNGISWSKGCYMGQELTARMHYRALVKKRLYAVHGQKKFDDSVARGTPVMLGDKKCGEMKSSHDDLGLALLDIAVVSEAQLSGGTFTAGNITIAVAPHAPT